MCWLDDSDDDSDDDSSDDSDDDSSDDSSQVCWYGSKIVVELCL